MRRMNLRDVPDDVYRTLAEAAAADGRSLNAFVVERLAEAARVARLNRYVASYRPPAGTGVTVDEAVAAVRETREAS
jgi:hypothetical protein